MAPSLFLSLSLSLTHTHTHRQTGLILICQYYWSGVHRCHPSVEFNNIYTFPCSAVCSAGKKRHPHPVARISLRSGVMYLYVTRLSSTRPSKLFTESHASRRRTYVTVLIMKYTHVNVYFTFLDGLKETLPRESVNSS